MQATPLIYPDDNISSKVLYDGTNNILVQYGQTINTFVDNVVTEVNSINASIAAISQSANKVATTGITSAIVDPTGKMLSEWLTDVSTYIEAMNTYLTALDATQVAYTADYSTIGKTDPTNVGEALDTLLEYIEDYLNDVIYPFVYAKIQIPLYSFYTKAYTITDTSVSGVPMITISALDLWGNSHFISKNAEQITLTDDKDNYVYIALKTDVYTLSTVTIGNPAPTMIGQPIFKVTVSGGVIGTPVTFLESNPILGDLIKNDAIEGNHIKLSTTFSAAFTKVGNIVTPVVKESIELDTDGVPHLVGDKAVFDPYNYYGSNAAGTKGVYPFPYYASATNNFIQFSDGASGFKEVNDTYSQAKYETKGAFTFGYRQSSAADFSVVFGNSEATNVGEIAQGVDAISQNSNAMLSCETTDATPTYMSCDSSFITTRTDSVWRVELRVVATDFDTNVVAIFDTLLFGVVNTGGVVTFSKSYTPPTQTENTTLSDLTVSYDVEINSSTLDVKVTGKGGASIRWAAHLMFLEINNRAIIS